MTINCPEIEELANHNRLTELVLDHIGIPRPGQAKHIQELQDRLLPAFIETARQAWLAASPYPYTPPETPNSISPSLRYLLETTQARAQDIVRLNEVLSELGVHTLLEAVGASPFAAKLGELPIDSYEARLLKASGHPDPLRTVREALCRAAQNPGLIAEPEKKLNEAAQVTLNVHGDIHIVINPPQPSAAPVAGAVQPEEEKKSNEASKPKKWKLFTGFGKLCSGLVLLTGNGITIPSVTFGNVAALPLLSSFAGGLAAVGDGIGQLRKEGE